MSLLKYANHRSISDAEYCVEYLDRKRSLDFAMALFESCSAKSTWKCEIWPLVRVRYFKIRYAAKQL